MSTVIETMYLLNSKLYAKGENNLLFTILFYVQDFLRNKSRVHGSQVTRAQLLMDPFRFIFVMYVGLEFVCFDLGAMGHGGLANIESKSN